MVQTIFIKKYRILSTKLFGSFITEHKRCYECRFAKFYGILQGIWQIFFEGTGQSLQITEAPLEGNHKSEDKISERGLGVKETQTQTGLANLFEYLLLHPQPPQ